MAQLDYALRFEEALRKAFAAQSDQTRDAYLDLASFYHRKLPNACLPGFADSIQ